MTWEQKLQALQELGECSLRMREPGNWYVSQTSVDIKEGSLLGGGYGNGATPEQAVNDHWERKTNLKPNQYLVINAFSDKRRAVRWSGFMWASVTEAKP